MRIGIISDSHGKADRLREAVQALSREGAETVVHCGDIGSAECLEVLASNGARAYAVAGNMDRKVQRLAHDATRLGVEFGWEVVEVPLGDGQYLVATHGHDEDILGELILGQQFPYVCHGHTHEKRDECFGPTRIINPGALHHADPYTVALLDTDSDELRHIPVC
ncbi:MAG: metallophosphoesterase family protein [Phycisphaerae bacterium]